jgi:hypothetical protein
MLITLYGQGSLRRDNNSRLFYPRPLGSAADPDVVIEGARRLRNANETDWESRNAIVGPLAHLDRADSIAKSELFWTRSSSSRPGDRGGVHSATPDALAMGFCDPSGSLSRIAASRCLILRSGWTENDEFFRTCARHRKLLLLRLCKPATAGSPVADARQNE